MSAEERARRIAEFEATLKSMQAAMIKAAAEERLDFYRKIYEDCTNKMLEEEEGPFLCSNCGRHLPCRHCAEG